MSVLWILVAAALSLAAAAMVRGFRARCPRCGLRALRWTHARVDGGKDERFAHNPRYCASCGWTQGAIERDDDGLRKLPAGSAGGAPVAIPLDVDPPETDPVMKQIEAAAMRMVEQSAYSARRKTAERARKIAEGDARASHELDLAIALVELNYAMVAVAEGAELQAEQEILRDRLDKLGVPDEVIREKLKALARLSQ